jgi:hypothetical protein
MQQQVWRPTKHGEKVLNSKFISSKNLAKTPKIMQMYKNAKIKRNFTSFSLSKSILICPQIQ